MKRGASNTQSELDSKALVKALKSTDLNKRVHPDLFRHVFATHLLEVGEELRTVHPAQTSEPPEHRTLHASQ